MKAASVPHAIIDLDEIRRIWPRSPWIPFGSEVEPRNVESLAPNYLEAGADRLVLAGVCESGDVAFRRGVGYCVLRTTVVQRHRLVGAAECRLESRLARSL